MRTSKTLSAAFASRPRRFRQAAAGIAVLVVLVLATACGGGSGGGGSSSPTSSPSGGLATTSTPLGTILTDSAGKSLYGFAADATGVSNCSGQCLHYWPPVLVTGSIPKDPQGVTAKLGELTRDDGTKQLTVNGMPMYTYVGDSAKGDTNGQGLNDSGGLWWVVATDGTWITGSSPAS